MAAQTRRASFVCSLLHIWSDSAAGILTRRVYQRRYQHEMITLRPDQSNNAKTINESIKSHHGGEVEDANLTRKRVRGPQPHVQSKQPSWNGKQQ